MGQALTVYFIFNVFLFCMAGYLFIKTTPDLMKKRSYRIFKVFILGFEFYLVFNTLWTMQEFDVIHMPKALFTVLCFFSLVSALFNSVCFYKFSMIYFGYSNKGKLLYEFFGVLPFLVMAVLLIISIFNGMVYSVSDDLRIVRGPLYNGLFICGFIYFAIIFVSSIVEMFRKKSPTSRKNCLTISSVVIFLVVWLILDDVIDGFTIIPIAIFTVLFTLFIAFQQTSMNTDSLTQMFNRRKAVNYLSSQLLSVSSESPLYLYLCDINHFKEINDNYGHLEGDNALIITANVIKEVVGKTFGFIARYGGDEFIIALKAPRDYNEADIIKKIDDSVKTKCNLMNKPYEISISYGCVQCTDATMPVDVYIKEADDMLYQNKKKDSLI